MRIPPLIAPSLLSADFMRLAEELDFLKNAGADAVHVDVMDGRFTPNITIGLPVVEALRRETRLVIDCHLMIAEPLKYAVDFVKAGADWVSVHQEADMHLHRTVTAIKNAGAKVGVALNPSTPIEVLTDILDDLDFVLLMSVNPGFSGQAFIERTLDKARRLDALRQERGASFFIQVDGGINSANAQSLINAGADCLVAGNAIFKAPNPTDALREIKARMVG
ncbi:MAG: ribulose-phosphate 3-epimerase [Holophagales bacterium]|jgi:ribulose-phosphate 3-epimerase|nr:ribulose-phosphate 3-epimerase [Holophagales bacterium]